MVVFRPEDDLAVRFITFHVIMTSISLMVFGYGQIATRNFDVQHARDVASGIHCVLSVLLVSFSAAVVLTMRVRMKAAEQLSPLVVFVLWAVVVVVNTSFLILYYTIEQAE